MKQANSVDGSIMCLYMYSTYFGSGPHLCPIVDLNIHSFFMFVETLLLKCGTNDSPLSIVTPRYCNGFPPD